MENISEKRKRGRPRLFDAGSRTERAIKSNWAHILTSRGRNNVFYMFQVVHAIEDSNDVELKEWIGEDLKCKKTLLYELGRLDDPEMMLQIAHELKAMNASSAEGVEYIRRYKRGTPPGSAKELATCILNNAINKYEDTHSGMNREMIREALLILLDVHRDRYAPKKKKK